MEQLIRIATFLSQYVNRADGGTVLPPDPAFIKSAIKVLIDNKVMTAEQIRREALKEYLVIIPYDFFPANKEKET